MAMAIRTTARGVGLGEQTLLVAPECTVMTSSTKILGIIGPTFHKVVGSNFRGEMEQACPLRRPKVDELVRRSSDLVMCSDMVVAV